MKTIICRCEDIAEDEFFAILKMGVTSIEEIKRLTRAGMGHCQGRTCKKLIAQIIARETGKKLSEILFSTTRPPIKPVELKTVASRK
jgi:bacterioferritin-associated ferredoxin